MDLILTGIIIGVFAWVGFTFAPQILATVGVLIGGVILVALACLAVWLCFRAYHLLNRLIDSGPTSTDGERKILSGIAILFGVCLVYCFYAILPLL